MFHGSYSLMPILNEIHGVQRNILILNICLDAQALSRSNEFAPFFSVPTYMTMQVFSIIIYPGLFSTRNINTAHSGPCIKITNNLVSKFVGVL